MLKNIIKLIIMVNFMGLSAQEILKEDFEKAPASSGWTYLKSAWSIYSNPKPDEVPAWTGEKSLTVLSGERWTSPVFKCGEFKYYKLTFKSKTEHSSSLWGVIFFDAEGNMLEADIYSLIFASPDWSENEFYFRGREGNVSAAVTFVGSEKNLCISDVRLSEVDSKTVADWEDRIYCTLPKVDFKPAPDRFKFIPKTEEKLRNGGKLRIVMIGDSIVNDVNNSNFEVLLDRIYPKTEFLIIPSVGGGKGCAFYSEHENFKKFVLDRKPDLLMIGGISQGYHIEAIKSFVELVKEKVGCEILLCSTAFFPEIRNPADLSENVTDDMKKLEDFGLKMEKLAAEEKIAYFDTRRILYDYILESGKPYKWFHRDNVHANERGKQVLGRVLEVYFSK